MGGNFKSLVAKIAYSPLGNFFVQLVGGARLYAELKVRVSLRRNLAIAEKEFMKETAVGNFNDYKDALSNIGLHIMNMHINTSFIIRLKKRGGNIFLD